MKNSDTVCVDMIPVSSIFSVAASKMVLLYSLKNGACIRGVWGKDVCTKGRSLKLVVVYPDGEISRIYTFSKRKLINERALIEMTDLDGISPSDLEDIFKAILEKKDTMKVQEDGSGKCSLECAYQLLANYVEQYEMPGEVFIRDGYGNIRRAYLPTVLEKLGLGYSPLELSKEFSTLELLRSNQGTGHPYSYKINVFGRNDWYFSFRLPGAFNNLSMDSNNEEVA